MVCFGLHIAVTHNGCVVVLVYSSTHVACTHKCVVVQFVNNDAVYRLSSYSREELEKLGEKMKS